MINAKKMIAELKKELSEMTPEQRYDYAREAGFAVNEQWMIDNNEVNIHEVNIHEVVTGREKHTKIEKKNYLIFSLTKPMRNVA